MRRPRGRETLQRAQISESVLLARLLGHFGCISGRTGLASALFQGCLTCSAASAAAARARSASPVLQVTDPEAEANHNASLTEGEGGS